MSKVSIFLRMETKPMPAILPWTSKHTSGCLWVQGPWMGQGPTLGMPIFSRQICTKSHKCSLSLMTSELLKCEDVAMEYHAATFGSLALSETMSLLQ